MDYTITLGFVHRNVEYGSSGNDFWKRPKVVLIVPYMAMAFGAKESTGVILPMLCMADIIAVTYYKRIADWKVVAKLLPTAILGFFVAIFVDRFVPKVEHEYRIVALLAPEHQNKINNE